MILVGQRLLSLVFLIFLAAAARAAEPRPGFVPVQDAPTRLLPPGLRERLDRTARTLLLPSPRLRRLLPPVVGRVRLAVLLVELADDPRPTFGPADWERSLFSSGEYRRTPTGQPAFGSVRDYYVEQSHGALEVTGRVFEWVKVAAKRSQVEKSPWILPGARRSVLDGALDALLAREGKDALDGFDALAFVVSGGWAKQFGTVLWPHSSVLLHRGQPWRYYLMHAGTDRFEPIGVHAHELGHVLGLPDEYGLGHAAGSGIYCCMAIGNHGGNDAWVPVEAPAVKPLAALQQVARSKLEEARGQFRKLFGGTEAPPPPEEAPAELFCMAPPPLARGADQAGSARPLHLCAPCKLALGWALPAYVDPEASPRLFLEGVEGRPEQVLVLPLDAEGRERLVVEYRARRGFDEGLPRTGLLAWRTGNPIAPLAHVALGANGVLVPAHGVESVDAAHRGPDAVMFPWRDRRSVSAGRVRLSEIEEAGGRVYLRVGE